MVFTVFAKLVSGPVLMVFCLPNKACMLGDVLLSVVFIRGVLPLGFFVESRQSWSPFFKLFFKDGPIGIGLKECLWPIHHMGTQLISSTFKLLYV